MRLSKNVIRECKKLFKNKIKKAYLNKQIRHERDYEENLVLKGVNSDAFDPLTESEKFQVLKLWGCLCNNKMSFKQYEIYKSIRGFDPRYLSHDLYLPIVARTLNDYKYTKFYENKGLLGTFPVEGIRFPECFVRCINGEYYTDNMAQISREQAIDILVNQDEVLFKDSVESSGGKSINKLKLKNKFLQERREIITQEMNERGKDFVAQRCIRQSTVMAIFNETSVNTIRITTLYLNGKFSLLSANLRIGHKGSFVDNLGAGGVIVNVLSGGVLAEVGWTLQFEPRTGINDVVFKGMTIPGFNRMVEVIKHAHISSFSLCKFIGWDVTLDENNNVVVIELNSSQPGLSGEQACHGPIFQERTQEVIDYCRTKKFSYGRSLFNY